MNNIAESRGADSIFNCTIDPIPPTSIKYDAMDRKASESAPTKINFQINKFLISPTCTFMSAAPKSHERNVPFPLPSIPYFYNFMT